MPFTLAHPAIVLPLVKSKFRLSLTALIAGSMVPDFEFFFQMKEAENIGHHWYGIFLFDIPMAWIFCYLFHGLLKNSFIANLPDIYRTRFAPLSEFNWIEYAVTNKFTVLLSITIGVISHILWDAFTHANGIFVQLFPVLTTDIYLGDKQMPFYYVLQIGFSLIGMFIVYFAIMRLPADKSFVNKPERNKYFWPLLLILFALIFTIRIVFWPQYNNFWSLIMACMGGLSYAWIIGTLLFRQFIFLKNRA